MCFFFALTCAVHIASEQKHSSLEAKAKKKKRKAKAKRKHGKKKKQRRAHASKRVTGVFQDGPFTIKATPGKAPVTELRLIDAESASATKVRRATGSPRPHIGSLLAKLNGHANGGYKVRGKHGAAIVTGTTWQVADYCNATVIKVITGKVKVQDFAKQRTVLVGAGKSYAALR